MTHFFLMTPETAEKFFERCREKEAVTLPERMEIMNDMEKEGLLLGRGSAIESPEEAQQKLAESFKVLVVKKQQKDKPDAL